MYTIPQDSIEFTLREHHDIANDTVRVFVSATLAATGDELARAREMITEATSTVLEGEWSCTSMNRREDAAGVEIVEALATIRVNEGLAAGAAERVAAASRPGLRLRLERIEYRPPSAAFEEARTLLRGRLYEAAHAEAQLLNERHPAEDRPWRVASIKLEDSVADRSLRHHRSIEAMGFSSATPTELDTSDLTLSTRVEMTAKVVVRRFSRSRDLSADPA